MKLRNIFSTILLSSLMLAGGMLTTSCGDDDLDIYYSSVNGVTLKSFGPCPLTRGESMEVIGDNLGNVSKVLFPQGNTKIHDGKSYSEATYSMNGDKMNVTVPNDAVPGKLRLVIGSDTLVSKANISFEEEAKVSSVSYPDGDLRGGDIITIKGDYVWNIVSLSFEKNVTIYAEDFLVNSRNEVQVPIPADARSGAVTYNDGNELGEEKTLIDNISIKNAVVASVSPASYELGDQLTITGENLDLVQYASFPGLPKDSIDVNVNEAGTELVVNIPTKTYPGTLNLMQYNGIAVPISSFNPVMIAVTDISPKTDLKEGDKVTITGTHLDKAQYITLPSGVALASDEFESTSTTITFTVPESMGDGEIYVAQHSNYSVATEKVEMHHEGAEKPIWTGTCVVGEWNSSMDALSWGKYDWSTVKAGQELIIYLTMNEGASWSQLRVGNGYWAALPGTSDPYNLDGETTQVRITLTDEMINTLINDGGLVLCGAYFTVTQVALSIPETIIWSGTWACSGWSGNQDLAYGAYDWSTFTLGQKIVFTFGSVDPTSGWGCISPRMGNSWGNLSTGQFDFTPSTEDQTITFEPTADDISHLQNDGGLVITGDGFILKKVTIE